LADFAGHRNAGQKIGDHFRDRIRREYCESGDRNDYRSGLGRWEAL
jgi:hypothetical protein